MSRIYSFFQMVILDFKKDYVGSVFGILWAFIQPITMIFVLWFVFEIGFKTAPVGDIPFLLWLSSGIIPWFFVAGSLSQAVNSIISHSFFVKKTTFPVILLPLIKISSELIIHLIMIVLLLFLFIAYGFKLDIYWIQIPFFLLVNILILTGIGWIFSSLVVFIQDIKNLIPVLIQIGFWATPVFWSLSMVPEKYHFYIKLNPFQYIIQGYRDSFIYKVWFWEKGYETTIIFLFSLTIFFVGYYFFNRLKIHFSDII